MAQYISFIKIHLYSTRTNRTNGTTLAPYFAGKCHLLGGFVGRSLSFWGHVHRFRLVLLWSIAGGAFFVSLWILRNSPYQADPLLDTYLQMAGSLIGFTFAANALVRFRGTHDRISLILAFGFVLAGLIEAGTSMTFYRGALVSANGGDSISYGWLAGRTLLGVLLLAALAVERRIPIAREPAKEMAAATLMVGGVAYLTSVFYFMLPHAPKIHPSAIIPRPADLLPAAIYLAATIGYARRLNRAGAYLDRALFLAAALNVLCHITMSQSQHHLDAPYTLAHFMMVMSYVIVLGGTLLDNAQLFASLSPPAAPDPLPAPANPRRLIEVLKPKIQRPRRTGRNFAVLLFDLDDLKKINDRFGHLTGSRAIKRLGNALSGGRRAIDTPARYGGDEFALILPESSAADATQAAARICEQLKNDGQQPPISVSVGVAVYPDDGATIEKLLGAADRALYRMKGKGHKKFRLGHVAACL